MVRAILMNLFSINSRTVAVPKACFSACASCLLSLRSAAMGQSANSWKFYSPGVLVHKLFYDGHDRFSFL
jgi:hypothetical protein